MSPNLAGGPDGDSLDSLAADSAQTISNMLKDLTPDGGKEETPKPAGIYLGDGLPPLPARLAGRIGRWEFIDRGELCQKDKGQETRPGHQRLASVLRPICGGNGDKVPRAGPGAHGLYDQYTTGQPRIRRFCMGDL